MSYNCYGWGGFPLFPLFMMFIIAFIVYSIFSKKKDTLIIKDENIALKNLKNRYAKGEIDKDEYEDIKQKIL